MGIAKIKYSLLLLVLVRLPFVVYGQTTTHNISELAEISDELKSLKDLSYKYTFNINFPGNQNDRMKGQVFFDNDNKILFNNCNSFTLIYSKNWFYKADHRNKSVTIIDLNKEDNPDLKKAVEKDVFDNGSLINFIDSVVIKYGALKKFEQQGDIYKIEVVFPKSLRVKSLSMTYDKSKKLFVNYSLYIAYPVQQSKNKTEKITELMTCTDFKKIDHGLRHTEDDYFSVRKGVVTLKKYDKYKLSTKL